MKAVISDRIYLKATEDQQALLRNELKYVFFNKGTQRPVTFFNIVQVNKHIVSIPSGRTDLIPEGYEIVDKRTNNPVEFPEFKFLLRKSQRDIYDKVDSSCIINAAPSWGKTFTGIAIATKLKQKTLIVTHTLFIRNQWESEIKKTLGITPGVIGSGKFNIDAPIVVSNIQTLVKRMPELTNEFGTVITDECHHTPSSVFTKVVNLSKAKYKIGLSGTLKRKDGKHVLLPDYFSSKIYKPPRENMMMPNVYIKELNVPFSDNSEIPWALRVNELLENKEFRNTILEAANTQALRGHKVLVVSDRVEFLEYCHEILEESSVLITGKVKDNREEILNKIDEEGKSIVFGTTSIFSEGISQNSLSCLILTTPISDNDSLLEQLIGRIVRVKEGKKTPEVLDFVLKGRAAKRQARSRMGLYIKKGYAVKELPPA